MRHISGIWTTIVYVEMELLEMNRRELDAEVGQHSLKDAVTKNVGLLSKMRSAKDMRELGKKAGSWK